MPERKALKLSEEHELKLIPNSQLQAKLLNIKPIEDVNEILNQIRGVFGLADLKVTAESVEIISDEYFDTPTRELFKNNALCRVRRRGVPMAQVVIKKLLSKDP